LDAGNKTGHRLRVFLAAVVGAVPGYETHFVDLSQDRVEIRLLESFVGAFVVGFLA
jgi:hypothetical protein